MACAQLSQYARDLPREVNRKLNEGGGWESGVDFGGFRETRRLFPAQSQKCLDSFPVFLSELGGTVVEKCESSRKGVVVEASFHCGFLGVTVH